MSAPDARIDPELVARFRTDVATAFGSAPEPGDRFALAVSGGGDSMAMLALAAAAFPGRIIAATFDHRLRYGSADDAALVSGWCTENAVPHHLLVPAEPITGASLQAQARAARYTALIGWARAAGVAALATAHHADDAAETFLMRAARGSGLSGLAGIRPRQLWDGVPVIRPLLSWRRDALRALVLTAGLPFVDDPANDDLRHDRTRYRMLLRANDWLQPTNIARSAVMLAEADAEFSAVTDLLWDERSVVTDQAVQLNMTRLPREPRRRLVRRAITVVRDAAAIDSPEWSRASNIEALLQALEAGKAATHAGVKASPAEDIWHFRPAPPRRSL